MMKRILFSVLAIFITNFTVFAQASNYDFKIVGYYSLNAASSKVGSFPFEKVTHVNLWFLNPDSLGNYTRDISRIKKFIEKAHQYDVKVLFSIGGGGRHAYYHALLQDDKRPMLIQNLMSEVNKYGVDGVDVDLEGRDIDMNYEKFVVELAGKLKAQNKLITSAIAVYYKDQLSDVALSQYDFVNIMVYDRTGPWRPAEPGPHSLYDHAVEDLKYFGEERGMTKEKLVLGVPFYGYGFGPDTTYRVSSMNYRQIIKEFRGSENADEWKMQDGSTIYYNGIPTIKQKTILARDKASGIMIWQLAGDAKGSKSLLRAINEAKEVNTGIF
ncbi:MAG TPA: glycosyl hydrolase family 18 protein [Cyclobacteriaceae bacterium]|nr:glycosyl hydrolase family 18 protein [Cyclobacteriaceae bacterium]